MKYDDVKYKENRDLIHLEVLRIMAIFLVLFNHTGKEGFLYFTESRESLMYPIYLFISVIDKIAVPIFFMISGALLLKKKEPIYVIYKKRVFRMLIVLVSTSFILYISDECHFNFRNINIRGFLIQIYQKPFHNRLWYLYSYLGLLVALPLLRKLARAMSDKEYKYYIIAHITLFGFIPVIEYILSMGTIKITTRFDPDLIMSYSTFFFIIGYYFENIVDISTINKKKILLFNILGCGGMVIACLATHLYMLWEHVNNPQKFHNSMVALPAIAVYVSIKYICNRLNIINQIKTVICLMGSATFGVYLFENWFRDWTHEIYYFLSPKIGILPACFIWIICACILGMIIITIVKKIPLISKII